MKPLTTALACLAVSLLTYFQFPGHTWLQQDSQIYAPILERLWDGSVLRNEILASKPHVAYTLYDEAAVALRAVTRLDFHAVLALEQIAARAFGIWGLYLIAATLCSAGFKNRLKDKRAWNPAWPALFIAAICSLGASIAGPSVLTFEYEPTPRAFALPLAICAMGLVTQRGYLAAGVAGAIAFLYHAPTALPFWAFYCVLAFWPAEDGMKRRRLWGFAPLAAAVAVLAVAAPLQQGATEAQTFLARLSPDLVGLQQMRASYNWISLQGPGYPWHPAVILHHVILFVIVLAAWARLRREINFELRVFALGLPVLGMLSMPASWLLLDHWRLALLPQFQPMRYVLFVTLFAQLLAAVAGVLAAARRQPFEAVAWFLAAYVPSALPVFPEAFALRTGAVLLGLAILAWAAVRWAGATSRPVPLLLGLAAFFAIPGIGGVVNYPSPKTGDIEQLALWARSATPRDAVFHFADSGKSLEPGIFRANALRAVYVDWKGGGQVNYLPGFARQWSFRWEQSNHNRFKPREAAKYEAFGVRYLVVQPKTPLPGRTPVFRGAKYAVYDLKTGAGG